MGTLEMAWYPFHLETHWYRIELVKQAKAMVFGGCCSTTGSSLVHVYRVQAILCLVFCDIARIYTGSDLPLTTSLSTLDSLNSQELPGYCAMTETHG